VKKVLRYDNVSTPAGVVNIQIKFEITSCFTYSVSVLDTAYGLDPRLSFTNKELVSFANKSLVRFTKWQHTDIYGVPMYYFENTAHHASRTAITGWFVYCKKPWFENRVLVEYTGSESRKNEIEALNDPDIIIEVEERMISEPNLEYARATAIWEDATLEQLRSEECLKKHLIDLQVEFYQDMNFLFPGWRGPDVSSHPRGARRSDCGSGEEEGKGNSRS